MRGELWTAAATGYAGKPRPVVVVQDDRFDSTDSITVALMTTVQADLPLLRVPIHRSELNGLDRDSDVMIDKVMTIPRDRLGQSIGRLSANQIVQLDRGLMVFLGLAG